MGETLGQELFRAKSGQAPQGPSLGQQLFAERRARPQGEEIAPIDFGQGLDPYGFQVDPIKREKEAQLGIARRAQELGQYSGAGVKAFDLLGAAAQAPVSLTLQGAQGILKLPQIAETLTGFPAPPEAAQASKLLQRAESGAEGLLRTGESGLAGDVVGGLGQIAALFVPGGVAGKMAGFGLAGGASEALNAEKAGATPAQQAEAFASQYLISQLDAGMLGTGRVAGLVSENIPKLAKVVGEINQRTGGKLFRILAGAAIEGGEEFGQAVLTDLAAKGTYDPNRQVGGTAGRQALVGTIAGGIGGGFIPGEVVPGQAQGIHSGEGGPPGVPGPGGPASPGTPPSPVRPGQHIMPPQEVATPEVPGGPSLGADEEAQAGLQEIAREIPEAVAGQVSPELAAKAKEDPLTGLLNKGEDVRQTEKLLKERKPGERVVRLRADFDNFSQINNVLGHEAGDNALKVVADAWRQIAREEDVVLARPGGDEFGATLKVGPDADAKAIAMRFEQAANEALKAAGLDKAGARQVGVSVGFAEGATQAELEHAADQAAIARKAERGISQTKVDKGLMEAPENQPAEGKAEAVPGEVTPEAQRKSIAQIQRETGLPFEQVAAMAAKQGPLELVGRDLVEDLHAQAVRPKYTTSEPIRPEQQEHTEKGNFRDLAEGAPEEEIPNALPPKRSDVESMMAFPPPLLPQKAGSTAVGPAVPEEINEGFDIPDETLLRKAQRLAQDKLGRLSVIQKAVEEQGGDIPESADVKTKTELFPGKMEEHQRRGKDFVKVITDTAGRGNETRAEIDEFLIARTAEHTNKKIQERRVKEGIRGRVRRLLERKETLQKNLEKGRGVGLKQLDREVQSIDTQARMRLQDVTRQIKARRQAKADKDYAKYRTATVAEIRALKREANRDVEWYERQKRTRLAAIRERIKSAAARRIGKEYKKGGDLEGGLFEYATESRVKNQIDYYERKLQEWFEGRRKEVAERYDPKIQALQDELQSESYLRDLEKPTVAENDAELIEAESEINDWADAKKDDLFERFEIKFLTSEQELEAQLKRRHDKIVRKAAEIAGDWMSGSGMTDERAQAVLKKHEGNPRMQRIGEAVDVMNREAKRLLVEGQVISQETADAWTEFGGPNYVPLRTFVEGTPEGSGRGFSTKRGPFSKRRKGRRTMADSPLAFSVLQYQQAALQAEQNKVGLSVLDFVTRNPDDKQWRVYDPGKRPQDLPPLVPERAFTVKVKGEPKIIEFADPLLARGLLNLGRSRGGQLGRFFLNAARVYSRLNTSFDPDFIAPNLSRDVLTAGMNMGVEQGLGFAKRATNPKNLYKSARAIYRVLGDPKKSGEYEGYFKEMRKAGGKVGWFHQKGYQQVFDEIESDLRAIGEEGSAVRLYKASRKILDTIDTMNSGLENAVRLSIYIEARKSGASIEQAAKLSRGATVDFNKHGEWGPAINAAYLFANANIQSTARGATTFVKNPKRAAALSGSMAALGATITTLGLVMGGEDEDGIPFWDKLSESDKQRNLIFMIPGWQNPDGSPRVIMIPLSYFWAHFYNMGRLATEAALGTKKKSQAMQDAIKSAVTNFAPIGGESTKLQTVSPTLMDPFVQLGQNKTWDGRPIYPPDAFDNYKKPASQRFYSSVSPLSKKLAQALNEMTGGDEYHEGMIDVSPEALDHLAEFAGGGAGRTLKRSILAVNNALKGEVPEMHEIPIIRRFVGSGNYEAYDRERYYEHLNEMAILEERVRRATKSGSLSKIDTPEARQIINENREAWRIRDEFNKKTGGRASLEEQLKTLKGANDEAAVGQFYLDFNKRWRKATGRNP